MKMLARDSQGMASHSGFAFSAASTADSITDNRKAAKIYHWKINIKQCLDWIKIDKESTLLHEFLADFVVVDQRVFVVRRN